MNVVTKAMALMAEAHGNAKDKNGQAFVGHPLRVAAMIADTLTKRNPGITGAEVDNAVAAALLHDVIEDTEMTMLDLHGAGFGEEVTELVFLMTRFEGTTYFGYIEAIIASENKTAMLLKIADIADNMKPERAVVGHDLTKRYNKALAMLIKGIANR